MSIKHEYSMRKIQVLLLLLIALPLACNAQVKKIVETYDNGQIKSITYRDKKTGLLEGHCVSYKENGSLSMEEDYKDGLRDGQVKYYDAFGNIESIVSYSKGKKQGKLIKYQKMILGKRLSNTHVTMMVYVSKIRYISLKAHSMRIGRKDLMVLMLVVN